MSGDDPPRLASPEIVVDVDADGVIVAVNDATEVVTGYTPSQLLGRSYHLLLAAEQAGLATRQFERKRHDPSLVTRYQVVIEREDGTRLLLEVSSRRIDKPGEPIRIRATAHTIDSIKGL